MKITKMVLLDKFKTQAIDEADYVSVAGLQDFVGTKKYTFVDNAYVEAGTIGSITLDEEAETLTVDDVVSYYDNFDFDFEVTGSTETPFGVYVLEVDAPSVDEDADEDADEDINEATNKVELAEQAYAAADQELITANTDDLINPTEHAALTQALSDAQNAKSLAQGLVSNLPETNQTEKGLLQGRLDALVDIVIPEINDADSDGVLDI